MASRLALSRFAPALSRSRAAPPAALRRLALTRGYATSEHTVGSLSTLGYVFSNGHFADDRPRRAQRSNGGGNDSG